MIVLKAVFLEKYGEANDGQLDLTILSAAKEWLEIKNKGNINMFDYSYLKGRIAGYETIYSFDEVANKAGMTAKKLRNKLKGFPFESKEINSLLNVLGIKEDRLTEIFLRLINRGDINMINEEQVQVQAQLNGGLQCNMSKVDEAYDKLAQSMNSVELCADFHETLQLAFD